MAYLIITATDQDQDPVLDTFGLEDFKSYETTKSAIMEKYVSEICFNASIHFPEDFLLEIANAVSTIKAVAPDIKTRLDLTNCSLQGSAFLKNSSKKSFSVLARLINAIGFDYIDLPPIRHEAVSLFTNSEVSVACPLVNSGWFPEEDLNIDTICFANSEALFETLPHIQTIQDESSDIFVKYQEAGNINVICASGFYELEDNAAASVLESYSVPKRIGHPASRKNETWKDADLTGKRVLIVLHSYTFDMCYSIAELVTMLKSMGASYVALYSHRTEMCVGKQINVSNMKLADEWFCEYTYGRPKYLEDDDCVDEE